jgi:hypothetical protein
VLLSLYYAIHRALYRTFFLIGTHLLPLVGLVGLKIYPNQTTDDDVVDLGEKRLPSRQYTGFSTYRYGSENIQDVEE